MEDEGVRVSYPVVYNALTDAGFASLRSHRRREKQEHPLRGRRSAFGELVQMDASVLADARFIDYYDGACGEGATEFLADVIAANV